MSSVCAVTLGHIHPQVRSRFLKKEPDQWDVVKPLQECFHIQSAERTRTGWTGPLLYELEPASEELARSLGLEVGSRALCVYAPTDTLEQEAIDLLDSRLAGAQPPVDRALSFVVSPDPKVGEKLKLLVERQPERLPLVGLSMTELRNTDKPETLLSLFRQRHFIRDYFAAEAPLTDEALFFGRDEVVSLLTDRIAAGQASGLFGLRRIGKTSVLYAVKRRAEAHGIATVSYRDMSPAHSLRWWSVLELLALDLVTSLDLGKQKRRRIAAGRGYTEDRAAVDFGSDIEEVCSSAIGGRICLLLDEIEWITFRLSPAEHWNEDFLSMWTAMRSVHQNSGGQFTYVISGVNPYALQTDRVSNSDNPLFGTTSSYYVPPLPEASMSDMVRYLGRLMGTTFTRQCIKMLHKEYGGHPFLTRQACSYLCRLKPVKPTVIIDDDLRNNREALARKLDLSARQILNVLETWYPLEYELLEALANGDVDTFSEFAAASSEFSDHVVGYGLVCDPVAAPEITTTLVSDVLRKRTSDSSLDRLLIPTTDDTATEEEVESRWTEAIAEVSRRRNAIERALRNRAKMAFELTFGNQRTDKLLDVIGNGRRSKLANLSFGEVWGELYFNELRNVYVEHWNVFEKWAGMPASKFDEMMRLINGLRIDAHAGEISEEELTLLRIYLGQLEQKLDI